MEIYEKIRYYREHTDYSQRNAAKILGVSRNTVKKYWEGQTVPWERKPRSVYNAAPIKETVPNEFYQFLMKLDSPKEIVKALRLYLDVGDELLKHLSYAVSYDTLYAGVIGNTTSKAPIETSVKIILPDLKRYDSLLKGGDAV